HFEWHAALPLTASGKIDRRALAHDAAAVPLRWSEGAPLQRQLIDLWTQLIGIDQLQPGDNVFERGARSLLVVRALTELRKHGHVLSAAQIYEHPTVAAQAALLSGDANNIVAPARDRARGAAQREAFAGFGAQGGRS